MTNQAIWIIIPAYNEAENITSAIAKIVGLVPTAKILVIDDSSPDGTGREVSRCQRTWPQVQLLSRPVKQGLGRAYNHGLRVALEGGAEIVVHLDADGSHPAEMIPGMIAALDRADLVLASRYVLGGSMKIDWWRRFISAAGNTYIRFLLGQSVHDWSTGFKVWRAATLKKVLDQSPQATGYAWLMETSWLAQRLGARIKEVPLIFRPRMAGQSKFNQAIAREDMVTAWRLRRRTLAKGV